MLAAGHPDSGQLAAGRPRAGLLAGEIGRVHRARGELQRAREIETDLLGDLEKVRARIDADQPEPVTDELDAETEAAMRVLEPLRPATRQAPERTADVDEDVEAAGRCGL